MQNDENYLSKKSTQKPAERSKDAPKGPQEIFLTEREAHCLAYLLDKKDLVNIEKALDMSSHSLHFYLTNVKAKLSRFLQKNSTP